MNAQHHQNMMDIAATPPWSEGYDDSHYDAPRRAPLTAEDWARLIENAKEQDARNEAEHQRRLKEDPAYSLFHNGFWVKTEAGDADKGRSCMVHFTRKGQGVVIAGPSGQYGGGVLSLYGYFVPGSKSLKVITVTLRQDDDPPQQLKVFSGKTPWMDKLGMVHFAVPDIDAAMAGMSDEMLFALEHKGEEVMFIKWQEGHKHRDIMKSCLKRQRSLTAK
ncbi:MAG: hypothetical protein HC788_01410 [Sphingopyxis sp.]|nr:hypothetical protein [Sphingopyxis sp.]